MRQVWDDGCGPQQRADTQQMMFSVGIARLLSIHSNILQPLTADHAT
jgi:hypothetical protein